MPVNPQLPPTPPTLSPAKPIIRLTQAKMCARREQCFSFNCDNQYRRRMTKDDRPALLLEPNDPIDPPPTVVEQPEHPIALHAISATKRTSGRAMLLEGFILQTPI